MAPSWPRRREGIIDPDRSIQIGIRTHAPEDCGIKILYGHEVEEMRAAISPMRSSPTRAGQEAYLTFDIDCLDPAFAPGTGTPVAGGPSSAKILSVLQRCTSSISAAPMSSRLRRPMIMPISPPLPGRRWRCICSGFMPSDAPLPRHKADLSSLTLIPETFRTS
jgi:hypothetical protein